MNANIFIQIGLLIMALMFCVWLVWAVVNDWKDRKNHKFNSEEMKHEQ